MRLLAAVVTMTVVGCDGAPAQPPDAAIDSPVEIDAPPDAQMGIDGTWLDTYLTVNGANSMSVCGAAPTAVVIDQTTAAVTPYTGSCKGDGSFRINAPGNLGTYFLKVQGSLYETTKHAGIDLSTDHLGRNDLGAITGVNFAFNLTGLDAWTNGDVLMAFGANVGFFQNLTFSSGGPTTGASTLSGSAPWFGYKVEAAKSDALQIVQLGVHTSTTGHSYLSLDRAYDVPAFTMTNNATETVAGAFVSPSASDLTLNVNVNSFNQFASVASPDVTTKTIAGSAYAAPSEEVIPSPSLISFARDSSTISAMNFGTVAYGDPFPASWKRLVKIQEAFQVQYTWNNISGTLNAQLTRVMTKAEAEANIIDARLGPPREVTLDGVDAFTATNISPVPVVAWDPPSLGTPSDYEVQVYEVQIAGNALKFVSTLRMVTKQTSVRLPAGYLLGQRQYVFVVRARQRDGSDLYTTPLRAGISTSTAETLSALVTTDS